MGAVGGTAADVVTALEAVASEDALPKVRSLAIEKLDATDRSRYLG